MNTRLFNPCTTNLRHQEPDAVYHIYNRLAHSVKLLDDEGKDDFIDRVRRVAKFSGVELLCWCVMTNHFHLLVYLPKRPDEISYDEFKRRLEFLHPSERAVLFEEGGTAPRAVPENVLERLFNIGVFMKIVKENFTIAYNERTGHHGTMWEGPYRFKRIPMDVKSMSTLAAYQNLNPVRACMAPDFTGYRWTAFAAACAGDRMALDGLRFIYDAILDKDSVTNLSDTLVTMMRRKMEGDLEAGKLEMAEALWRRRLAGKAEKDDPLTDEAKMVEVEERMRKLQSDELHREMERILGRPATDGEVRIVRAMAADPEAKTEQLARITGVGQSLVKKLSGILQKCGIVTREGTKRRSFWRINLFQ